MMQPMLTPPAGFHFNPRDAELIKDFLLPKSIGRPYPPVRHVIDNVLLYGASPWEVLKDAHWVHDEDDEEMNRKSTIYVFTSLSKPKGSSSRFERTAGCGTWKGQSKAKEIKFKGKLIGYTRSFSFMENKKLTSSSYDFDRNYSWVMYEYCLVEAVINSDWVNNKNLVLCKIIRHYRGQRDDHRVVVVPPPQQYNYNNIDQYDVKQEIESVGMKRSLMDEVTSTTTYQENIIMNNLQSSSRQKLKTTRQLGGSSVIQEQQQQVDHYYHNHTAPAAVSYPEAGPSSHQEGGIGDYDHVNDGLMIGDTLLTFDDIDYLE